MEYRYPIGENHADIVRSKTGKKLSDISLEEVKRGHVTADDIKISKEMLNAQGQVAREDDRPSMGENFDRAAELVDVPDQEMLRMYNLLRPHRATKAQLLAMADELENKYKAVKCAKMVREAAEIYEKRGILL
ncbi:MAG: diol dehydratase small subunit [Clostridia bacterium]|nr:diol dehydratase small subunit [Clostridia bacterium]